MAAVTLPFGDGTVDVELPARARVIARDGRGGLGQLTAAALPISMPRCARRSTIPSVCRPSATS